MILGNKVLYLLIFTTFIIFLATLVLCSYTLFLRFMNHLKGLKWRRLETRWEPVLLEILAGSQQPEAIWRIVDEEEGLYFVDFVQRYAQRLRGKERDTLSEVARPFIAPVANSIKTGDAEQRARAIQTLSILGLSHHTDFVIAALDDPSPLVAMIAARCLMKREHPEFTEEVLQRLHRFTTWSRNFLASMLASVGSDAAPALRKVLSDMKKPPWIRTVSADALIQLNDLEVADIAAFILESEADRELLAASLRILTRVGEPDHVSAIRPLCNSPDFVVRAHAVRAISRLAPLEETQLIQAALEDSSSWVAIQAAKGLREGGGLDILRDIALTDHPRSELARQILAEEMR